MSTKPVLGDQRDDEPPKRTAATRVLDLLGAFARGSGPLTLSEIARRADLSLPTAHRLVRELLEWEGLEVDATGRYRLGRKFLNLASQSTRELRLRERAAPHVLNLHRQTGCTIHLVVRDGHNAMFVDSVRPFVDHTGESRIGGHLPLHVTATGLVLLAAAPPDVLDDYLQRPLVSYTDRSIVDAGALRSALAVIRRQGFAVADGCLMPGWTAIAAPIDLAGDVDEVASIGLTLPSDRTDRDGLVGLVVAAARRVSTALADDSRPRSERIDDFRRRHASAG